ncbi:hypothetical protein Q4567_21020 [Aliiglaciecola sp. 2_MG-2023]|uniref:hypothetical protein n=1 Tax=Alteromonadaceae TaxID=72275 RepID=UPI0026E155F7|nr:MULTISPECIES: hypothetical protein [unclassified Aliiglaciecola]MDO6713231.1 hypothetical protein [Aliiglaciecola sp. 2_MG-2023]MDO6754331.1 hypothetical protein [Aliiglaciecola sp. 1_MG-2023]
MNSNKPLVSLISILFTILCLCFIGGCKTTDDSSEEVECRNEQQESCDTDDETGRGYDPCLVNESLPVCKP